MHAFSECTSPNVVGYEACVSASMDDEMAGNLDMHSWRLALRKMASSLKNSSGLSSSLYGLSKVHAFEMIMVLIHHASGNITHLGTLRSGRSQTWVMHQSYQRVFLPQDHEVQRHLLDRKTPTPAFFSCLLHSFRFYCVYYALF